MRPYDIKVGANLNVQSESGIIIIVLNTRTVIIAICRDIIS
jgi:hypothetical protein